jgi:hypothetical protein
MTETTVEIHEDIELEDPVLVEGLAGIGHVGKTTVEYLAHHCDAKKIGEVKSTHFPPFTLVNDNQEIEMLQNNIYAHQREDGRDIILIEGDAQASTNQGHYQVAEKIVDFAEQHGAHKIITVGGHGTGDVVEEPSVYGTITPNANKSDYQEYLDFDHELGQVVGASGLILGYASNRGIEGVGLLGETPGFLLSDPSATEAVLETMEHMLGMNIDFDDLEEKVQESQDVLEKLQNIKKNQGQNEQDQGSDLGYIG